MPVWRCGLPMRLGGVQFLLNARHLWRAALPVQLYALQIQLYVLQVQLNALPIRLGAL